MNTRHSMRIERKRRIRAKVTGVPSRPRMTVFRSNRNLSVQLIDDTKGKTLVSLSINGTTKEQAKTLGRTVAEAASAQKIQTVVFDRSGYRYHGVLQALADSAREGGLRF